MVQAFTSGRDTCWTLPESGAGPINTSKTHNHYSSERPLLSAVTTALCREPCVTIPGLEGGIFTYCP